MLDQLAELIRDEQLPGDLRELIAAVAELAPHEQRSLAAVLQRVVQNTKRRREVLLAVQDALAQLRLDTKYLMFDLEATRRERDAYRAQLDS
jgi:hypothetical protein